MGDKQPSKNGQQARRRAILTTTIAVVRELAALVDTVDPFVSDAHGPSLKNRTAAAIQGLHDLQDGESDDGREPTSRATRVAELGNRIWPGPNGRVKRVESTETACNGATVATAGERLTETLSGE